MRFSKYQRYYEKLDSLGQQLEEGLLKLIEKHNITATINRIYGSLTLYFTDEKVTHYDKLNILTAKRSVNFQINVNQGMQLTPFKFEAWFLTTEHCKIQQTLKAADYAFSQMK